MPFIGTDGFVYLDQKVLVGFMRDPLKATFIDDYFSGCPPVEKTRVLEETNAAEAYCSKLNDGRPKQIEFESIPSEHSEYLGRLSGSQTFRQLIGTQFEFAIADLRDAIAVQPNVTTESLETKAPPMSPSGTDLIRYCLPDQYTFQLQVTINANVMTFSGLDNNLTGVGFAQAPVGGMPFMIPISRGNWVQVGRCRGRAFLVNGYHRVAQLMSAGTYCIPCIVRDFASPEQMGLGQGRFFELPWLMGAPRPPVLGDFATPAAIRLPGKRARTTIIANLQTTLMTAPG